MKEFYHKSTDKPKMFGFTTSAVIRKGMLFKVFLFLCMCQTEDLALRNCFVNVSTSCKYNKLLSYCKSFVNCLLDIPCALNCADQVSELENLMDSQVLFFCVTRKEILVH